MHLTAAICSPSDGRPVCCQPVSLPSLLHCQPKQTSSQHDKEDCRMTWKPTGMTRSSISLTPGPPRGTIYPFWPDVAPHPPSRTSSEEPSPQYHHHCTTGQLPSLCVGLLFRCVRYLLRLATSSHPNPTLVLLPPGQGVTLAPSVWPPALGCLCLTSEEFAGFTKYASPGKARIRHPCPLASRSQASSLTALVGSRHAPDEQDVATRIQHVSRRTRRLPDDLHCLKGPFVAPHGRRLKAWPS